MSKIGSNLLNPGFCFRSLEELKKLSQEKLTPEVEKISRLALTFLVPLALVADLVTTSLAVLTIVPFYYYGSELLKQAATSWLLLAGTPIVMLLYLCKENVFDRVSESHPLTKPEEAITSLPIPDNVTPPKFSKPSVYPDTELHRLIISNDWASVRTELISKKAKREDLEEKFDVTWNGQVLSITWFDFIILATAVEAVDYPWQELTECLSEFGSWQVSSSIPPTVRDGFVVILLESITDPNQMTRYGISHKRLSIIRGLQGKSVNSFHEAFLTALEKVREAIEKAHHCTMNAGSAMWIGPLHDNLKKNQIEACKQLLKRQLNGLMPSVLSDIVTGYIGAWTVVPASKFSGLGFDPFS